MLENSRPNQEYNPEPFANLAFAIFPRRLSVTCKSRSENNFQYWIRIIFDVLFDEIT